MKSTRILPSVLIIATVLQTSNVYALNQEASANVSSVDSTEIARTLQTLKADYMDTIVDTDDFQSMYQQVQNQMASTEQLDLAEYYAQNYEITFPTENLYDLSDVDIASGYDSSATNDPRFYPDPLSKQEKYWLNKLGAIIEAVPGNPQNPQKCLYPQGRALQNFPNADWNVIGPKCANCRLLTLQNVNSISQMVTCLLQHGKVCTPVIAPNGGIKLGESALCPEVSNIYKSEAAIIQDIRQCTCQKCEIAWDNLKKVHPTAYYLCGGK